LDAKLQRSIKIIIRKSLFHIYGRS